MAKISPLPNGTIVYELKGRSLEAALVLEQEIRKELAVVPVKNTGNLGEIRDSWDKFYDGLVGRLQRENPEVLALTGLSSAVTQVSEGKDSLPRAYRTFPEVFSSPERAPRYFMYVPVGYDGAHFVPEGGKPLGGKQEQRTGDLLFAGGWLGNAPLVSMKKTGVATPADYEFKHCAGSAHKYGAESAPAPKDAVDKEANTRTWRCFIAGGESLQAVEDCDARTTAYRAAADRARAGIAKAAEEDFPALLRKLPAGEDLRAGVSYRYGGNLAGKTEMLLSVRQEGKSNLMSAGKTVALKDNQHYRLTSTGYGEYVVAARDDTPEGRALGALIGAIPPTPSLADYPALRGDFAFAPDRIEAALGVNGVLPQARKLGGLTILAYNSDDFVKSDFCPPGAQPLPTAAYLWLQSDESDRNMGVTPPPMPPEVAQVFKKGPSQGPGTPKF